MGLLDRVSLGERRLAGYYHKLQINLRDQFEKRRHRIIQKRQEIERVNGAVETIVEGTDARLRSISGYQKELGVCARDLLDHIEHVVASLPKPLVINSYSLNQNPLARTLLSDKDVVQRLLIRNQDIKEFFSLGEGYDRDEVFALLFIRHRERTILGSEIRGDIILREVKQTCLGLYGHRLVSPCMTEEDVRFEMVVTLFEGVTRYIKDKFLDEKKRLLKSVKKMPAFGLDGSIINPRVYLDRLIEELDDPKQLIRLEKNQIRVSKLGIKLPLDSTIPSDLLNLHTIQMGDTDSCIVTIVCYPRDGLACTDRAPSSLI